MSLTKQIEVEQLYVKVYGSRLSMGKAAAKDAAIMIKNLLNSKEEINIVFASAPSQNEFYESLVKDPLINWQRINAFHMDEYIDLGPNSPKSFGYFLKEKVFSQISLKSTHYLNGNVKNLVSECKRYTDLLSKYPTDIVFMGIGENGHIAFNDPHVAKFSDEQWVKVVTLDSQSRQQQVNDGCFNSIDVVPTQALTLTVPALVNSLHIFCVVPGPTKAQAIYNTLNMPINEECPASILRMHNDARLYVDHESSKLIVLE